MGTVSRSSGDTAAQAEVPAPHRRPGDEPRGYESPDYDQPYVREPPQRANSSRTDFPDPHLLNHAAADSTERGEPASNASLNDHELVSKERDARSVGIRDRIACFRWSWFTMTMVCVSLVLYTLTSSSSVCFDAPSSDYPSRGLLAV